jgi:hypothetical protein
MTLNRRFWPRKLANSFKKPPMTSMANNISAHTISTDLLFKPWQNIHLASLSF